MKLSTVSIGKSLFTGLVMFAALAAASPTQASPGTPVPAGLVAWWPAEGNANDVISGNTAVLASGVTFATGEVGQAFLLNNPTNAYFMVPRSPSLNVGSSSSGFTLETWIKPSDVNGLHPLAEWNDEVAQSIGVIFAIGHDPGSSGVLGVVFVDTNGNNYAQLMSASGALVPNAWQHVAVSYDRVTHLELIRK